MNTHRIGFDRDESDADIGYMAAEATSCWWFDPTCVHEGSELVDVLDDLVGDLFQIVDRVE